MTLSLAPVISFHLCLGSPGSGRIEWHGVQWDWRGEEDLLVLALGACPWALSSPYPLPGPSDLTGLPCSLPLVDLTLFTPS